MAAPGPSAARSRRRGTSHPADGSRTPCCRIRISSMACRFAAAARWRYWFRPESRSLRAQKYLGRKPISSLHSLAASRLQLLFVVLWSLLLLRLLFFVVFDRPCRQLGLITSVSQTKKCYHIF